MTEIRFGTDGWRGVIADDYTFDNVRAVAQATAEYLTRHDLGARGVVVGYDTRFLSAAFARACADVLAANGITVAGSSSFMPTPVLSHAVQQRDAGAGVMITASHNPARWNGFKLKLAGGAPAPETVTSEIEQAIPQVIAEQRVQSIPLEEGGGARRLRALRPARGLRERAPRLRRHRRHPQRRAQRAGGFDVRRGGGLDGRGAG